MYDGIIGYLHLDDFWDSMTKTEQATVAKYYRQGLSSSRGSPISGKIGISSQTQLKYLSEVLSWAIADKKWALAEKIIKRGERATGSAIDRHFFQHAAGECYYKQISTRTDAIDIAMHYFEMDINNLSRYASELAGDGPMPRIDSFKKMAMCYEIKENYAAAIEVCERAIKVGQSNDGTKGGMVGRIDKLKAKATKR